MTARSLISFVFRVWVWTCACQCVPARGPSPVEIHLIGARASLSLCAPEWVAPNLPEALLPLPLMSLQESWGCRDVHYRVQLLHGFWGIQTHVCPELYLQSRFLSPLIHPLKENYLSIPISSEMPNPLFLLLNMYQYIYFCLFFFLSQSQYIPKRGL